MFLNLPVEIQNTVYDNLDIKHRAKLNMALPRTHTITHTLKTNPDKDKKLRYLSYMIEKKKYTHSNQLSRKCMEFISENQDDPTIKNICKDLNIVFNPDTSVMALITDITNNHVSPNTTYTIPEDTNLTHIQYVIAAFATPSTFDTLYWRNPTTSPVISEKLLKKRQADRSFFFELVNYCNSDLLKHLIARYAEEEWLVFGINYLKDISQLFFFLGSIKCLCEIVKIPEEKKKQLLQSAIDQMDTEVADYMTSIGTTL